MGKTWAKREGNRERGARLKRERERAEIIRRKKEARLQRRQLPPDQLE